MPRRPSRWGSAVLLAAVIGFCLLITEAGLRLFYPQELSGTWTYLDDQNNLLNRSGGRVRHQLVDRVVYYRFNATHQRGSEDASPTADHVLVLGDSFTFGWGLPEGQTYVGLLQKNLDALALPRRIQLLNAATAGWGTADEVAYLRRYAEAASPKGVVVFVSFDDFRRALRSRSFRIEPASGDIARVDTDMTGAGAKRFLQELWLYNWLLEHSEIVQLVRHAIVFKGGVGLVASPGGQPGDQAVPQATERAAEREVARALFRWIKRWTDERGISLIVLTTGWYSIDYPWLAEEIDGLGIRFVDLGPSVRPVMLRDKPETFFIPYDGHPNALGARLIGDAAWQALEPWFRDLDRPR